MTLYGLRLYEKVRLFSKQVDRNKICSVLPVVWHYTNPQLKDENVLCNGCSHPTRTKKALMLPNYINIKRQSTSYFQDAQFCWAQIHQLWDAFVLILKCFWMNFESHLLSVGFCRLGVVNKRVLLQLITICSCTCGEDEISF